MKYKLFLVCGIAPLLLTTVLSIVQDIKEEEFTETPVYPPMTTVIYDSKADFYQQLVQQLDGLQINNLPTTDPDFDQINDTAKELAKTSMAWKKIIQNLPTEEKIKDLCDMGLKRSEETLEELVRLGNDLGAPHESAVLELTNKRKKVITEVMDKIQDARASKQAWEKGKDLYEEAKGNRDPIRFAEAGIEFDIVTLEVFLEQNCEKLPRDLTEDVLANSKTKATFMKDATRLSDEYETFCIEDKIEEKRQADWKRLMDRYAVSLKTHDPETPGNECIDKDDDEASEYKRMDDDHRRIKARYELAGIFFPKDIVGLPVYIERVEPALGEDRELREAVQQKLESWLLDQLEKLAFKPPTGEEELKAYQELEVYQMMVDEKTEEFVILAKGEEGFKLIPEADDPYWETKEKLQAPLDLYMDETAHGKTLGGILFKDDSLFKKPMPPSPLTAHKEQMKSISTLKEDSEFHQMERWERFETELDEQLRDVQLYRKRGGKDFGTVDSLKKLYTFTQGVLVVFKDPHFSNLLKKRPVP